jgi:NADH:ubiquinone oxidoreductase subunit 4 (subunit M)
MRMRLGTATVTELAAPGAFLQIASCLFISGVLFYYVEALLDSYIFQYNCHDSKVVMEWVPRMASMLMINVLELY